MPAQLWATDICKLRNKIQTLDNLFFFLMSHLRPDHLDVDLLCSWYLNCSPGYLLLFLQDPSQVTYLSYSLPYPLHQFLFNLSKFVSINYGLTTFLLFCHLMHKKLEYRLSNLHMHIFPTTVKNRFIKVCSGFLKLISYHLAMRQNASGFPNGMPCQMKGKSVTSFP